MSMIIFKIKWHICAVLKTALYKLIFGSKFIVGGGTTFRSRFNVYLEKNAEIKIGRNCFFNNDCSLNALEYIEIGDGNIFGENVKIYDHNHKYSGGCIPLKNQGFDTEPVIIGDNCWFGSNVTVLKGVHIGSSCVIGAGCLIYDDIEEGSVVMCGSRLTIRKKS
ncbi:MAG: acyltransferase [Clostridiales bacterium]|nr:acyltransferase [Clostridiales bacterium]